MGKARYTLVRMRTPELVALESAAIEYLVRHCSAKRGVAERAIRGSLACYVASDGRGYVAFDGQGRLLPHVAISATVSSSPYLFAWVARLAKGAKLAAMATFVADGEEEYPPFVTQWGPDAAKSLLGFFSQQADSLTLYEVAQKVGTSGLRPALIK
jgi:hypothetical protein